MTCREFKQAAESLTLWELARSDDQQMFDHAVHCAACAIWLEERQMLAAGMQALKTRTAGREAGPHVERSLLQAFRQESLPAARPMPAQRLAPVSFDLRRFFAVGAYAAVAAVLVVGLFLGVGQLDRRSAGDAAQSQAGSQANAPAQNVQLAEKVTEQQVAPAIHERPAMPVSQDVAWDRVRRNSEIRNTGVATAPAADDPDYVALMFCDPLICSGDAQVVRMELPVAGTSGQDAQTQVADVVVGDDGLVRAMRIVSQ